MLEILIIFIGLILTGYFLISLKLTERINKRIRSNLQQPNKQYVENESRQDKVIRFLTNDAPPGGWRHKVFFPLWFDFLLIDLPMMSAAAHSYFFDKLPIESILVFLGLPLFHIIHKCLFYNRFKADAV
ncbi:MAG: hypothetical protein V1909_01335 [Candidatus Micrarchaeota archaeon]